MQRDSSTFFLYTTFLLYITFFVSLAQLATPENITSTTIILSLGWGSAGGIVSQGPKLIGKLKRVFSRAKKSPPGCFISTTTIIMANGKIKEIRDVQIGDLVLAQSINETSNIQERTYDDIIDKENQMTYNISFDKNDDSISDGTFNAINSHKLWILGKGMISVKNVCIDDIIKTQNNDSLRVIGVSK